MFKAIRKLSQNKIFYCCIALLIFLIPNATNVSSESERTTIITAIGVDKVDNDMIELSAAIVVTNNTSGVGSNLAFISGKGSSINSALDELSMNMGKRVGLAHCEAVIVSDNIFEDNAIHYLDYFIRTNNLTTDSIIINSQTPAKDVIKGMVNYDDPYSQALKRLIDYNDDVLFTINMNVENFYKAYYSKESIALLTIINARNVDEEGEGNITYSVGSQYLSHQTGAGNMIVTHHVDDTIPSEDTLEPDAQSPNGKPHEESDETQGLSASSGENEQQDTQEDKKTLYSQGAVAVIKEGKKVRELDTNEISTMRILSKPMREMFFAIYDVNIHEVKNAQVVFEIFDKKLKKFSFFNNGIPTVKYDIVLHVKIDEVLGEGYSRQSVDEIFPYLYDDVLLLCNNKIVTDFSYLIENCKDYQTDILAFYDIFYKFHNKEWKAYIDALENPMDYLQGIVVEVDCEIRSKL